MTRGEPEENKPNAQGQDGVIGSDGGSVPDTDGGGDDREDTVPGGAAPDAAAGDAPGGARCDGQRASATLRLNLKTND
ncbi:hypothetical protein KPL78_00945 [Roseomonas sp. HJA6]|uniref:Uncharacterized protein n=2 Tax=Roseomonas alba TaxID=2846776 RepID=A0ABS7A224_9PROT|nr:hypothetical protein [Neoroseomonas alba]